MRVKTVQRAQKDQGRCLNCGEEIKVGDGYQYAKPRYGPRRCIHTRCGPFKGSQLTSNDKLADLYAITEEMAEYDVTSDDSPEDVQSALDDFASRVREVAELYREVASNIEDGFGHATSQSEEAESNADELDGFADSIEATDVPEKPEEPGDGPVTDEEMAEYEDALNTWAEEATTAVVGAADGCPL